MSTILGSAMLGTTDPDRLHAWYTAVLPPRSDDRQGDYRILGYGGDFYLFIDRRDDVQASHPDPARTILNFDVDDVQGVADRATERGSVLVSPVEDRHGSLFVTVQDPDGNYVQAIQLSDEHRASMEGADGPLPGGILASEAFSGFSVDDLAAAEAFYGGVLGLRVLREDEMGLLTIALGGRQVLVYPKADHAPATYTILNFPVADVEAAVRELAGQGVEFLRYDGMDQDELGINRGGGPLIAWFTDPAGNVLSVLQRD